MKKYIAVAIVALGLLAPVAAFAATSAPVKCTLTATPSGTVTAGTPVTLKWTTTNASSTSWSDNAGFSSALLNGSVTIKPTQLLSEFFLTANGPHGFDICEVSVETKLELTSIPKVPSIPPIPPIKF